jgi:hypothetical protein
VLPSVGSLASLRGNSASVRNASARSHAPEPFIGLGNPKLSGNPTCGKTDIPTSCSQLVKQAANQNRNRNTNIDPARNYFRGLFADVEAVRQICPLPETARELSCVAESVGARSKSLILGAALTETAVKQLHTGVLIPSTRKNWSSDQLALTVFGERLAQLGQQISATIGPAPAGRASTKIQHCPDVSFCSQHINPLRKGCVSRAEGVNVMKFQMATPHVAAAKSPSEGETPDLRTEPFAPAETDVEIAKLVPEVGACSIAEFEKLLGELQEAKSYLQSEGERIQRETAHYANLAQTASASVKIISDTVREWREAGHPAVNRSRSSDTKIGPATRDDIEMHPGGAIRR